MQSRRVAVPTEPDKVHRMCIKVKIHIYSLQIQFKFQKIIHECHGAYENAVQTGSSDSMTVPDEIQKIFKSKF